MHSGIESYSFLYPCFNYTYNNLIKWGVKMEKIIMPELITPAFAEVMASNPEILEQLIGMQTNEETIANRSLEFNSNNMPKVLKLLFCNVRIEIGNSEDTEWEALGSGEINGDTCEIESKNNNVVIPVGKEGIKEIIESLNALGWQIRQKDMVLEQLSDEVTEQREKVVILETRMKESTRTLKLVFKEIFNRKLSYRYKMDIQSLTNSLEYEKKALEEKKSILNQEKRIKYKLEEKSRNTIKELFERLVKS